ncbi:MAG TPA: heme o synthase [Patescibacteria group bacterium]|nr:heme o synthase [Patescibacteria group bacterium]
MVLKSYYHLTKPGIIYGNLVTTAAGFLLASTGHIDLLLLVETLVGVSLVIASACVFNNYIDRGIDANMARTKQRALVSGKISAQSAIIYATLLGLLGFLILVVYTNPLTVVLGLIAMFVYVVLYGYAKRKSVLGTVVGSIAGALPPVAGYTAVTGSLDGGAALLFLILVCWQMPHFYAIAMYRFDDYKRAKLPVLPVVKGMKAAKVQILLYISAFTLAGALFTIFGYTHIVFLVVVGGLGLSWLYKGIKGFSAEDDKKWARGMFFYSLIVTLVLSVMLAVGARLP